MYGRGAFFIEIKISSVKTCYSIWILCLLTARQNYLCLSQIETTVFWLGNITKGMKYYQKKATSLPNEVMRDWQKNFLLIGRPISQLVYSVPTDLTACFAGTLPQCHSPAPLFPTFFCCIQDQEEVYILRKTNNSNKNQIMYLAIYLTS